MASSSWKATTHTGLSLPSSRLPVCGTPGHAFWQQLVKGPRATLSQPVHALPLVVPRLALLVAPLLPPRLLLCLPPRLLLCLPPRLLLCVSPLLLLWLPSRLLPSLPLSLLLFTVLSLELRLLPRLRHHAVGRQLRRPLLVFLRRRRV